MRKKRVIIGFSALGALVLAAGCGGSGSYTPSFNTGHLNFTGSPGTTYTSTVATPISSTAATPITFGGTTFEIPLGALPAGTTSLPAGTQFQTYPAGIGFPGVLAAGSELIVNGNMDATGNGESQIFLGTNGLTITPMALPVLPGGTTYSVGYPAGTYSTARDITVGHLYLNGTLKKSNVTGDNISDFIPASISGNLPNNGQNVAGSVVTVIWADPTTQDVGETGTLVAKYGPTTGNFKLTQSQSVISIGNHNLLINGKYVKIPSDEVTYSDFVTDAFPVPSTGLTEVDLSIQ